MNEMIKEMYQFLDSIELMNCDIEYVDNEIGKIYNKYINK